MRGPSGGQFGGGGEVAEPVFEIHFQDGADAAQLGNLEVQATKLSISKAGEGNVDGKGECSAGDAGFFAAGFDPFSDHRRRCVLIHTDNLASVWIRNQPIGKLDRFTLSMGYREIPWDTAYYPNGQYDRRMDKKEKNTTGDPLHAAITTVLRLIQEEAQITDVAIAKATALKVQSIRRWMDDERPMPATAFMQIAEALGTDPNEVIRRARQRLSEQV